MALGTQDTTPHQAKGKSGKKSFLSFNTGLSAPVSKNSSGEAMSTIIGHFNKVIESSGAVGTIQCIAIDPAVSNLIAPAIAVIQKDGDDVAIFTILVEHGVGRLSPRTYKGENGVDLNIPTTMGDVYNATESFFSKVKAIVSKTVKANNYFEAGQCVIPTECSVDDVENLQRILHRATCATVTLLDPEGSVISIANLEEELVAHLDFTRNQVFTGAGLPIRKGFEISLYANARQSVNAQDLAVNTRTDITSTVGYVDLNHIGYSMIPNQMGQPVQSTQSLAPHIHITSTEVESGVTTPGLQYVSLAVSALLIRDNTYEQALRQKFTEDSHMHSLNGLKHEIGVEDIGAHQANFDLRAFMAEYTYPAPIFTLDVPECDDLSWCWSDLRSAALGDDAAYQRVYDALNDLTDNVFESMFPYGEPMAELLEDRVILGYYTDSKGEKIDLRHLDYLAALNLMGDTDTNIAFAYGDTFNADKGTLEQRLDTRIKIIDEMTSNTAVIKGYGSQLAIYGAFLTATYNAINAASGGIRVDNPTESVRTVSRDQHRMLAYSANSSMIKGSQYGTQSASSRLSGQMRGRTSNFTR